MSGGGEGGSAQTEQRQEDKRNKKLINYVKKSIHIMKMFFNCPYKLINIEDQFHI